MEVPPIDCQGWTKCFPQNIEILYIFAQMHREMVAGLVFAVLEEHLVFRVRLPGDVFVITFLLERAVMRLAGDVLVVR